MMLEQFLLITYRIILAIYTREYISAVNFVSAELSFSAAGSGCRVKLSSALISSSIVHSSQSKTWSKVNEWMKLMLWCLNLFSSNPALPQHLLHPFFSDDPCVYIRKTETLGRRRKQRQQDADNDQPNYNHPHCDRDRNWLQISLSMYLFSFFPMLVVSDVAETESVLVPTRWSWVRFQPS